MKDLNSEDVFVCPPFRPPTRAEKTYRFAFICLPDFAEKEQSLAVGPGGPGGGGNITCLGYWYVPPIWMALWVQNSLNKGPLFGRFCLNMGEFSRNWQNVVKNELFSPTIHHISGYDGNCW